MYKFKNGYGESHYRSKYDYNTDEPCKKCGFLRRKDCDGKGWMEALGPYRDGSYMTSRPCLNDNPYFE